MKHFLILVLSLLLLLAFVEQSHALLFDRRPKQNAGLSYYIYPLVIKLPGYGSAYGGGATLTRVMDSEADLTAVSMKGEFDMDIIIATDIPIFTLQILD